MTKIKIAAMVSFVVICLGTVFIARLFWSGQSDSETLTQQDILNLPYDEIENRITAQHPALYMTYAGRVFGENSKAEGIFWYYVAQIRYRHHLAANPDLEVSGDPALYASFSHTLGTTINKHAGSNPDLWIEMIERALEWDDANQNGFTSKTSHAEEYAEVRKGLEDLKAEIRDNRQAILDRDKMPRDWPSLLDLDSVKELAGDYSTASFDLLPIWLLGDELSVEQQIETEVVRISQESDSSILVTGIAGERTLGQQIITLNEAGKGYSFTDEQGAEDWGLHEGGSTTVITLFRTQSGT